MALRYTSASSDAFGLGEAGARINLEQTRRVLLRVLRADGASPEDAADIVQETLLVYVRNPADIEKPMAYLHVVARRQLRRLRQQQARWALMPNWDLDMFDRSDGFIASGLSNALPADSALDGGWDVQAMLDELTPRQRVAMSMLVADFDTGSIASRLGVSPHAVHVLIHRARQRLQRAFYHRWDAERLLPEAAASVVSRQPVTPDSADRGGDAALATLRRELNQVWQRAGSPTVRAIAMAMGREISHPTVHRALKCTSLPKWNVIELLTTTLNGQPSDLEALRALHERCAQSRPNRRTA